MCVSIFPPKFMGEITCTVMQRIGVQLQLQAEMTLTTFILCLLCIQRQNLLCECIASNKNKPANCDFTFVHAFCKIS